MKVQIGDDVVWRELDEQVVIFDTARNQYFGLEGSGGAMWRTLVECGSTESALESLAEDFDADPEELRNDLDTLVKNLVERGLLQTVADIPPSLARKPRARR
ncbi:MAG TPA: PqqD family protein [Candidatus Binataceae bacterium]|nr:PqqD family protein [Candidatus Binataceae bacterium]